MSKYFWPVASVAWALLIFQLTTTPQIVVSDNTWLQQVIMIFAHFIFFGIQAVLIQLSLTSYDKLLTIYAPAITTSLYGAAIELVQRSVPGRSADPVDWLLDTLGAFAFLWFVRKYSKL